MIKGFRNWNNITGWIVFAVSLVVYLLTIEPTVSFWDCGEFILCSYRLEVGHPPGAPLFMLLGRFFTLFAGSDTSKVAMMVNIIIRFRQRLYNSFPLLEHNKTYPPGNR